MQRFLVGWFVATLFATVLKTVFLHLTMWLQPGDPATPDPLGVLATISVAAFAVEGPALLLMFAAAAWISRQFPGWHLCIFAIAGSVGLITPRVLIVGLSFTNLFNDMVWKFTVAEIVIGAAAGVICGWIARPPAETAPVSR